MDAKTREALEASIAHWERNVAATQIGKTSVSSDSCALCNLFNPWGRSEDVPECEGCPVKAKTGLFVCDGSPYLEAWARWRDWGRWSVPEAREAWRVAAQAELDFLKSLLPTDEPANGGPDAQHS